MILFSHINLAAKEPVCLHGIPAYSIEFWDILNSEIGHRQIVSHHSLTQIVYTFRT